MVRKIIDIILTLNLIIVVGYLVYLWQQNILVINFTDPVAVVPVEQDIYDVFDTTLKQAVDDELGAPIEGYEPQMFKQIFPGLSATDFDGVAASIGSYVIVDGQLQHVIPEGEPVHSAASAITRRGTRTLLDNVAIRLDIDLKTDGTITEVMTAISS